MTRLKASAQAVLLAPFLLMMLAFLAVMVCLLPVLVLIDPEISTYMKWGKL